MPTCNLAKNILQQMASAIWQLKQWFICRHYGWFHQSIHVGHEISSISQGKSIRQLSREGETPTKDCLMFRPTLRKSQGAVTTLWQRCLELPNFTLTCSTWKARKCLALRSTNSICRLESNRVHTGQIESTLLVHELKQGPLELELLVVLWPTYRKSVFPTPR
jgi:hypothetical protein